MFQGFMKFERERDIPAFKGKNWREKYALQIQAEERDPWILRLRLLIYFLVFAPIILVLTLLANQLFPHFPLFATMPATIVVVGLPIDMALYSLFIVPRIRTALDSNSQAMA